MEETSDMEDDYPRVDEKPAKKHKGPPSPDKELSDFFGGGGGGSFGKM